MKNRINRPVSLVSAAALGTVIAAALVSTGCGGGGTTAKSSGASGAAKFRAVCAQCHGPTGKGMPNLGKDITTSAFVASQTDEQLVAFIKEGRLADHPDNTTGVAMPPKGGDPTMSDAQIQGIVSFVRSIQIEGP